MKIAVIGDIHYPIRARELPLDFFEIIREENPDITIYTGDLGSERTLEEIEKLSGKLVIVRGNTDWRSFPEKEILEIGPYRILVFHSTEVYPRGDIDQIVRIAKENNCNFVIFGHTHIPLLTFRDGIIVLNPGSATGARSGEGPVFVRSFAIIEINGRKVDVRFILIPLR